MDRKINKANIGETELPGQSYVLETGTVPYKPYSLDADYIIRAINRRRKP